MSKSTILGYFICPKKVLVLETGAAIFLEHFFGTGGASPHPQAPSSHFVQHHAEQHGEGLSRGANSPPPRRPPPTLSSTWPSAPPGCSRTPPPEGCGSTATPGPPWPRRPPATAPGWPAIPPVVGAYGCVVGGGRKAPRKRRQTAVGCWPWWCRPPLHPLYINPQIPKTAKERAQIQVRLDFLNSVSGGKSQNLHLESTTFRPF